MRYFVHVYRTVRSKILIDAANHREAMEKADESLEEANRRLQYEYFSPLVSVPEERKICEQLEAPFHLATDDAEETTAYMIDELGDEEYHNSVTYDADYTPHYSGPKLKLFFVACDDEMGENFDAVVQAENAADAQRMWAEQWEWDITDPDRPKPRIWEINPPKGQAGVLGWNTMQLNRLI